MKKSLLILRFFVLGIAFFSASESFAKTILKITTFNIKYYGLGGEIDGTPSSEKRDPSLKKFISSKIPQTDIFVFEEIVDVARLNNILPAGWNCLSYDSDFQSHQHVVLCHSSEYKFLKEPTDDNFLIDDVAIDQGKSRPAVTAIVADKNDKPLFRIVGVHLKAFPDFSSTRVAQAKIIGKYLSQLNSQLPVVITGDFNTYPSSANNQVQNDVDLILSGLNEQGLNLQHIANSSFTYRNKSKRSQFDQFYVSPEVNSSKPLQVFKVCNSTSTAGTEFYNATYYYQNVSDHCPVTAEIEVP